MAAVEMGWHLVDMGGYERRLRGQGFSDIAGVDEAGRGAWAGPMVAAAVILPEDFDISDLRDSKVLSARRRDDLFARITSGATAVAVCKASAGRIDARGLHRSNLAILRKAVRDLPVTPGYVLCDGWPLPGLEVPHLSMKKGDAVTASVAAASIVAKVTRDRIMERYHRRFPLFGFDRNKGYGTQEHRDALDAHGPTPIHRLSFRGVGPEPPAEDGAIMGA